MQRQRRPPKKKKQAAATNSKTTSNSKKNFNGCANPSEQLQSPEIMDVQDAL